MVCSSCNQSRWVKTRFGKYADDLAWLTGWTPYRCHPCARRGWYRTHRTPPALDDFRRAFPRLSRSRLPRFHLPLNRLALQELSLKRPSPSALSITMPGGRSLTMAAGVVASFVSGIWLGGVLFSGPTAAEFESLVAASQLVPRPVIRIAPPIDAVRAALLPLPPIAAARHPQRCHSTGGDGSQCGSGDHRQARPATRGRGCGRAGPESSERTRACDPRCCRSRPAGRQTENSRSERSHSSAGAEGPAGGGAGECHRSAIHAVTGAGRAAAPSLPRVPGHSLRTSWRPRVGRRSSGWGHAPALEGNSRRIPSCAHRIRGLRALVARRPRCRQQGDGGARDTAARVRSLVPPAPSGPPRPTVGPAAAAVVHADDRMRCRCRERSVTHPPCGCSWRQSLRSNS